MLFNSLTFIVFFIIVYLFYFRLKNHFRRQNFILLIASYVFYGFWDWRFLSLLLTSTCIDFFIGKRLDNTDAPGKRRLLVGLSVVSNLSILGFFKYFNFFADGAERVLTSLGMHADYATLNIILPIGISFYTFQSLSYTIDIYRKKMSHTDSFADFALFVAFFPQLVAGPIERAARLLPQIQRPRRVTLEQVDAGLALVLWGYFKKVVVADNVGMISDHVFNNYMEFEGLGLLVGVVAFAIQIYCDFSGYSDIARGICKLLGFELMVNFRLPYFALSPSDFWRRWHISLSSWLRDYVYISFGGNRQGPIKTYRNILLTMLLGGLWHGAAWNFIIWGLYHGLILCAYRMFDRHPEHDSPRSGQYSYVRTVGRMALMLMFTMIGWIIFRSQSIDQIVYILSHIGISPSPDSSQLAYQLIFFSWPVVVMEVIQYYYGDLLIVTKQSTLTRGLVYGLLIVAIMVFGVRESLEFIYFQF